MSLSLVKVKNCYEIGKYGDKKVYMNEEEPKIEQIKSLARPIDISYDLIEEVCKNHKIKYDFEDIKNLKDVLLIDADYPLKFENVIKDCKKIIIDMFYKDLNLDNLFPVPTENLGRDCYLIFGPSGSGKSHFSSLYIKEYRKKYPKNDVILISRVEKDDVLDRLGIKRLKIDSSLIDDPISMDEISNTLVLFDDVCTIPDKKIKNYILHLRDSILTIGRHYKTSCIVTCHQIMKGHESKLLLLESTKVVLFPKCGTNYSNTNFLRLYCGLSNKQIKKILEVDSRWVMISRAYPYFVMYDKGVFIL
jgi:hypothetical protein